MRTASLLAACLVTAGLVSFESVGVTNFADLPTVNSILDATINKKWLMRAFLISAAPIVLLMFRLSNEQSNRKSLMKAVQSLRREGREVSSASLSETTGLSERTVQVYLPAIATRLRARTLWYQEGDTRHQRLEVLPNRIV
jgi:hypothetical protein